jgi:hypothetical protein
MKPKILLFDIESAPGTAYIWQCKTEYINPSMLKDDWYVMCWAAKWLGEKKIMSSALCDHSGYDPKKPCDKAILSELWSLLDEADIVVAHNGKKFDCRKSNARFIRHGMTPPSPYRVVDTLSEARKHFMFMSNRLNELGRILRVGEKLRTGGFDLWLDCMNGDLKAWGRMVKYCKQDVLLLEKVYLRLRPYMKTHPNLSIIEGTDGCSKCGSTNLIGRGYFYNNATKKHRYQCKNCGGYGSYKMKYGEITETRST